MRTFTVGVVLAAQVEEVAEAVLPAAVAAAEAGDNVHCCATLDPAAAAAAALGGCGEIAVTAGAIEVLEQLGVGSFGAGARSCCCCWWFETIPIFKGVAAAFAVVLAVVSGLTASPAPATTASPLLSSSSARPRLRLFGAGLLPLLVVVHGGAAAAAAVTAGAVKAKLGNPAGKATAAAFANAAALNTPGKLPIIDAMALAAATDGCGSPLTGAGPGVVAP